MHRHICLSLTLTLVVACSDDAAGPDLDDPLPRASAALVSAPLSRASGALEAGSVRDGGPRVFVSMPPGTEPGGTGVTIRVMRTDASVTAEMVDGGFDPVAVEAVTGDSLAITVARPSGSEVGYARVPAGSTPVVVRTSPRHRRVDVPLNPVVLIVFNQPMDPGTLGAAIRLLAAGVEFAGTATAVVTGTDALAAQFVPDGLLDASTTYELEVSTAAQDRAGTPLASPVRVEFTTGTDVTDATLVVNVTTAGTDVDPNGYDVILDDAPPQPIDANGTLSIPVPSGPHTLTLAGATANCIITDPTRDVTVATGATVTASFVVTCSAAAATGALRIITSTAGTDLDADAYRLRVDAAPTRAIGLDEAVVVSNLAGGVHIVTISELSRNCVAAGGRFRSPSVTPGTTVVVTFDIACSPVGTGTLVVTTSASGPDQDADGYSVSIDGGPPQSIASSGTLETVLPDTVAHSVQLTGISRNCSLPGGSWREAQLSAGTSTVVAFEIECTEDFRPSGTIAFATQSGSTWSIFTSQADGSGRVRIATGAGSAGQLAWSPDGRRLALTMATSSEGSDIFVMDANGTNLVRRTDTGWNRSPSWSPDGHHLAFVSLRDNRSDWGIYVMNVDEEWREVALIGPPLPYGTDPAWSPAGTRIAFSDPASEGGGLFMMQADGSGVRRLALPSGGRPTGRPAWSPDGATIAVPAWEYQDDQVSRLVVMSSDGFGARFLPPAGVGSPAWSPDGSIIAFQEDCGSAIPCTGFVTPEGRVSSVVVHDVWGVTWRP